MDLTQRIKQCYFDNLADLPEAKRFHFASRLAAWEGSTAAKSILSDLKNFMTQPDSKAVLLDILGESPGNIYAKELRLTYFKKYPKLFGIHNALFRVRHLMEIYDIDAREDLLSIISRDELAQLYKDLTSDMEAVRILSRFAIDYIYLYEILYGVDKRLDPSVILSLKDKYDFSDIHQLHLFIYLYTHCIIADSNFYIKEVPDDRLPIYHTMLGELEAVIANRRDVKLDNKFELLVASRICGRETQLAPGIMAEAEASLSDGGTFIIDKLNHNASTGLNTFKGSEHRNVLFIMASTAYNPQSTVVS